MGMTHFRLCLGVLTTLVVTSCFCREDKDPASNQELEERLDILTNEMKQLKADMAKLKGKESATSGNQDDSVPTLQLVNASRHFLSDGRVQFTIVYKQLKNGSYSSFWMEFAHYSFSKITNGSCRELLRTSSWRLVESSVITEPSADFYMIFNVDNDEEGYMVYLKNDLSGNFTQSDIQSPVMEVSPARNLVYKPDQNVTLKIARPEEEEDEPSRGGEYLPRDNFRLDSATVLPGGDEVMMYIPDKWTFFHTVSSEKYLDKWEVTIELNTAQFPYSGILEFVGAKNNYSRLILRVERRRTVKLYPSTQHAPFESGQLFSLRQDWMKRDENGTEWTFCKFGSQCSVYCNFFGNNITQAKLLKTVNGLTEEMNMIIYQGNQLPNNRISGFYQWTPQEGDTSPASFSCMASDAEGNQAVKESKYYVGMETKILANETYKEMFSNKSAWVTCTARGSPLPNVTISCGSEGANNVQVLYQTDEVISVGVMCEDTEYWFSPWCTADNGMSMDNLYDFSEKATSE